MCAPAVGKKRIYANMLSKCKTEASERAVHQSDLQKRFTRSVRRSSLRKHKREMIEQKPLPKSQLTKQTLVAHASKLIIKI